MPLVLITTCLMYRNRVLVISLDGWRVGQHCNLRRSSPVSPGLPTPIFACIGNDDFWSYDTDFRLKLSPKNGNFEFYWISRRARVGFPKCLDLHMHYFATVSASSFQVIICSGSRASTLGSFIRFLACPARTLSIDAFLWTCVTAF